MSQLFSVAVGWLLFTALVVTSGSLATHWLILRSIPGANDPSPAWLRNRAARVGRVGGFLLPLAMALSLVRQVGEFRDPFAPLSDDLGLLLGTTWGTAWLYGLIAAVTAAVGFFFAAADRRWGWWLGTVAIVGLSAFPGLTGHAGGQEGALRWLVLSFDALHVLAAGAWIGGLGVVLTIERHWRRGGSQAGPDSLLPVLVPRFSPVAMVSVGILIVTGTLASWIHLPDLAALWTTSYGRFLVLKVSLVSAVLGLGAMNWKHMTPMLSTTDGPAAMRKAAAIELSVAMVVLVVTAILVRTSPLGH